MLKSRLAAVIWICLLLLIAPFTTANADITIGKVTTYHPGDANLFDLDFRITNFSLDLTAFDLTWHIYATFDNVLTDQCDPFSQQDCECIYFKSPLKLEAAGSYNNWNNAWWVIKDGSNTLYSGHLDSFFVDEFSIDEEYSSSFMGISLPKWIKGKGSVVLTSDVLGSLVLYINDATATHITGFPTYKVSCKAELNTSLFTGLIPPKIVLKGDEVIYHPEGAPFVDPGSQILEIKPRYSYTSKFVWTRLDLDNFNPNAPETGEYTVRYIVTEGGADFKGIGALPNIVDRTVKVISNSMPTVKSVSPVNSASIPINSNISATFSVAMEPSTINMNSFKVTDNSGAAVPGIISYNSGSHKATFDPTDDLSYGMNYTATLTTNITTPEGIELPENYTWSFSTPAQTSAFGFALTGETLSNMFISVNFSSEIDTSTVNTESFFVESEDGLVQISGTVQCTDSRMAIFIPTSPENDIDAGITYKASITSEVMDLTGNPVKAEDWLFTVESLLDSDGDGMTPAQGDCNDNNAAINPESVEIPYDGIDQDCSGSDLTDVDGDGFNSNAVPGGNDCNDNDAAIHPGAIEACDGKDNNCNGSVDEGLTRSTACGTGACASIGIESCIAGVWAGNTCIPGTPSAETCDNIDNDCDGSVDEGLTQPTTCGTGACASTGIESCIAGTWTSNTCIPGTPSAETCDNIDNDCDGSVDEDLTQATTCGTGACASSGVESCIGGVWTGNTCTPGTPSAETCDNIDNDCDGEIDEDLSTDADKDGHYAIGSCHQPADDCDDGNAAIHPGATEICGDGIDQDCSGEDLACETPNSGGDGGGGGGGGGCFIETLR